jgi:hypothetical protein
VPLLKVGLPELEFNGRELPLQDTNKEVPTPARWLQESGIDAFRLALHQVEHCLHQPRRGEDLPMVGDALF